MKPVLKASLVCGGIAQEPSGHLVLMHVDGPIRVQRLPATVSRLHIVNFWTAGEGLFKEKVQLIAPDKVTVVFETKERPVELDRLEQTHVNAQIVDVRVNEEGIHWVRVLLEEEHVLEYPLPVTLVKPPPKADK